MRLASQFFTFYHSEKTTEEIVDLFENLLNFNDQGIGLILTDLIEKYNSLSKKMMPIKKRKHC